MAFLLRPSNRKSAVFSETWYFGLSLIPIDDDGRGGTSFPKNSSGFLRKTAKIVSTATGPASFGTRKRQPNRLAARSSTAGRVNVELLVRAILSARSDRVRFKPFGFSNYFLCFSFFGFRTRASTLRTFVVRTVPGLSRENRPRSMAKCFTRTRGDGVVRE